MSKGNKHTAFYIILGLILAGSAYFIIKKFTKKGMTKEMYANSIIANKKSGTDQSSYDKLVTYEFDYLKAWYEGLSQGADKFSYKGKQYYTKGGTAV